MNMHMAVNLIVMWIPDSLAYLDVLSYTLRGSIWADGLLFSITVLWFVSKHQANKAQEEGGSITFYSWKPCSLSILKHCNCNCNCNWFSLIFQECPNGTVDRDTFKKIYAQFFPYGGIVVYINNHYVINHSRRKLVL